MEAVIEDGPIATARVARVAAKAVTAEAAGKASTEPKKSLSVSDRGALTMPITDVGKIGFSKLRRKLTKIALRHNSNNLYTIIISENAKRNNKKNSERINIIKRNIFISSKEIQINSNLDVCIDIIRALDKIFCGDLKTFEAQFRKSECLVNRTIRKFVQFIVGEFSPRIPILDQHLYVSEVCINHPSDFRRRDVYGTYLLVEISENIFFSDPLQVLVSKPQRRLSKHPPTTIFAFDNSSNTLDLRLGPRNCVLNCERNIAGETELQMRIFVVQEPHISALLSDSRHRLSMVKPCILPLLCQCTHCLAMIAVRLFYLLCQEINRRYRCERCGPTAKCREPFSDFSKPRGRHRNRIGRHVRNDSKKEAQNHKNRQKEKAVSHWPSRIKECVAPAGWNTKRSIECAQDKSGKCLGQHLKAILTRERANSR